MSLARDVIQLLRRAIAAAAAARDTTTAVQNQADEIIAEIRTATDGSTAEKPAEAIVRLEQAKLKLDEAKIEFQAGNAAAEEYIAHLEDGGGSGGSPDTTSRPSTPPQSTSPRPFKPMRTDPGKRDEITPYVGLDYAVATLWDAHGNRILGPHEADDDGPAARAKWRAPWGQYPRLRRHVEAHAAARLRSGDTMAMYINLPPCKYFDGCDRNLADLLPKGATLHVHWVQSNNMVRVFRFRGTGKALDD